MATIQEEIQFFRDDNASDTNKYPDLVALRHYNDARDEIIDEIIKIRQDYFYNYITGTTVIGQREYTIPKRGDVAGDGITVLDGMYQIKGVSVKFKSTDTDFTPLKPKTLENLSYDIDSYAESQEPFYILMDESIFIFPTPTEELEYRIHGITYPKKVGLLDTDILPDHITKACLIGMAKRYFQRKQLVNEMNNYAIMFENEKKRVCDTLSARDLTPRQRIDPISYI